MRWNIHPFMEYAHDIDCFRGREVENEMAARRIDSKAPINFVVDSTELGLSARVWKV